MLSVQDSRARGSSRSRERSRSRGAEDRPDQPRARSRDIRAPSPARAPSPPRSSRSGRSKKYYEPDSDSEAFTASEEEYDHRGSRRRREEKYEPRSSRREDPPPERDYRDDDRRYEKPSRDERDRGYDAHPRGPGGYAYAQPNEYTQQMNYVKPGDELAYGDHYIYSERKKHPSMNAPGAFPADDERDRPQSHHDHAPMSPTRDRPPYMMVNAPGSRPQYQVPPQYQYAQPDPRLSYLSKHQGGQYTATPDAQIEIASRKSKREEEEEERYRQARQAYYDQKGQEKKKKKSRDYDVEIEKRDKYRVDSDDEKRRKKYRDDSEDEKRKKKYKDDSDYEKRKKKYRDDSDDDDKRKKKYRDDSDDDKKKKKKYRDDSDDDKRKKKYREDSDDDRRKKYRDDSDDGKKKKKKDRRHSDSDEGDRRKPSRRDTEEKQRSVKHDPRMVEIHPGGAALGAPELGNRMHRLSVSGQAPSTALSLMAPGAGHGHGQVPGAFPPGSPLLEAYHGTYQSISPMPSPMALPSNMDDGMSDLEPLDGDMDEHQLAIAPRGILKKRVEIYDPEPDALAIAAELKHTKPGAEPLVQILPALSDDNIMALRTEYKKHFKVNGKGINIAKHIKLKVPGNIGKAAYATALGRWESEAYWSNFWYQSNTSRRELLIESLIGRSNLEIRKIKEAFSDKRYNDSLEKCMQAELKKDKFRHAVLLALEEKRQDELEKLSKARIETDARELYKALVAKEGGETAMIDIIVVRSDTHLRQVLIEFEQRFKANFARQMIAKSQNLVGETLAHILNGVLNRPVRDALLLHQAINETAKDRAELLVSRLVRMHWEPRHLERVKAEYKRKYGHRLENDVAEGTKGDFRDFCVALCSGAVR